MYLVLSLLRESLLAFCHSLISDSSLFMLLLKVVWSFGCVWLSKEWRDPTMTKRIYRNKRPRLADV